MEYRPFGQTGINISAIGFGCWEIGGGYGSIEETEFVEAINRALDVGLSSFDTAEAYGMGASEKVAGQSPRIAAQRGCDHDKIRGRISG